MIKTAEDYSNLKAGLANVTRTVNDLIEERFILINGQKVKLEFYLGGDFKVSEILKGVILGGNNA